MTLLQVAITMQTGGYALDLLTSQSRNGTQHVVICSLHSLSLLQSLFFGARESTKRNCFAATLPTDVVSPQWTTSRRSYGLPIPAFLHLRNLIVRNWRALLRLLIDIAAHILSLLYLILVIVETLIILLLLHLLSKIFLTEARLHLLLELRLRHEPLELI